MSVRDFCLDNGFISKTCNEVEICLTEALNNIVRHAYKEDFSQTIDIEVKTEKNELQFDLMDKGIPRKNFKKPELEFDPEDIENLPEGGMGLYIIDQLMNEISYETVNGVNIFTMKKIVA